MSLIATLYQQRKSAASARNEAAIHRFEVVLDKLKSNNDLVDAKHYGANFSDSRSGDSSILRKMEFSNDVSSVSLVVREDGQTFLNGSPAGDLNADDLHERLCQLIVDKILP